MVMVLLTLLLEIQVKMVLLSHSVNLLNDNSIEFWIIYLQSNGSALKNALLIKSGVTPMSNTATFSPQVQGSSFGSAFAYLPKGGFSNNPCLMGMYNLFVGIIFRVYTYFVVSAPTDSQMYIDRGNYGALYCISISFTNGVL